MLDRAAQDRAEQRMAMQDGRRTPLSEKAYVCAHASKIQLGGRARTRRHGGEREREIKIGNERGAEMETEWEFYRERERGTHPDQGRTKVDTKRGRDGGKRSRTE